MKILSMSFFVAVWTVIAFLVVTGTVVGMMAGLEFFNSDLVIPGEVKEYFTRLAMVLGSSGGCLSAILRILETKYPYGFKSQDHI